MLGKLLKDELKSYLFPSIVALAIGTGFTVFFRILTLLPYRDENVRGQMVVLIGYALYYLLLLMISSSSIFAIVRFYKTAVGDCGYLTWTLPVKTSTVIWSKTIGALILKLVFVLCAAFDMFIYLVGNLKGVFRVSNYYEPHSTSTMFSQIMEFINARIVIMLILFIVLGVIINVYEQLSIYFCMAVGQLVGRMRILASIGCYVVISILNQIFVFAMMLFGVFSGDAFLFNTYRNPSLLRDFDGLDVINGSLLISIIVAVVVSAVYFAFTNYIFKNRLNLE